MVKLFKPLAQCALSLALAASLRAEGAELMVTGSAASLGVFAQDAERASVLGRICTVAGTNVVVHGDYQDVRVNDSFEGVHVRVALMRILAPQSYVLIHRRGVRDEYEVLLLSSGREEARWKAAWTPSTVSGADRATAEELAAVAVSAAEPAARASAIERIIYADASASVRDSLASGTVRTGLHDLDPAVRAAALRALKDSGDESRSTELEQMVLSDPMAEVRVQAMELLAERDLASAIPVLRAMAVDPNERVSKRAIELLNDAHLAD